MAIALLSHRRPSRPVTTTNATMDCRISRVPTWLFEESYHVVGDLAETIALGTARAEGLSLTESMYRGNH